MRAQANDEKRRGRQSKMPPESFSSFYSIHDGVHIPGGGLTHSHKHGPAEPSQGQGLTTTATTHSATSRA